MNQLNSKQALQKSQQNKANLMSFSQYINNDVIKNKINSIIGGEKGQRFITAMVSAVSNNKTLQECDNNSIFLAALLGESLNLSPSPQLGHYYLVPYKNKDGSKSAQFQLGYKGYIQLAIRSGQYKKLNVLAIKKGELEYFDNANEEIKIKYMIEDWDAREEAETIGYYAMFELCNGFRKAIYWSKKQMEAHAIKYSPGYKRDIEQGSDYTFWSKDFDAMAYKTMLRQLISKWGVMSIDMQTAFKADMSVQKEYGEYDYVDSPSNEIAEEEPIESVQEVEYQEKETTQEIKVVDVNEL